MPRPDLPSLSEFYRNIVFSNPQTQAQTQMQTHTQTQTQTHTQASDVIAPSFDRLVFIGENAVQFAVMNWIQIRYTKAHAGSLRRRLGKKMASKPNAWGRLYKLRSFCPISSFTTSQQSSDPDSHRPITPISPSSQSVERRSHADLFYAFVGALFLDHGHGQDAAGPRIINQWIQEIFEYEIEEGSAESGDDHDQVFSSSDRMRSRSPRLRYTFPPSSPTSGTTTRNVIPNGSLNGNNNSTNSISILNELATKKNTKLSWEETSAGPSHLSEWTAKLKLSAGQEEYIGIGMNKKIARAAAAELALKDTSWQ